MKIELFNRAVVAVKKLFARVEEKFGLYRARYAALDRTGRTRFLVLLVSLMLIFDYLMFSYLTDKNIFNVFPAIPRLDWRTDVNIYVPDKDAKNILKESRSVLVPDRNEIYAGMLYRMVVKGSRFDNTSNIVPVKTFIRNVWIGGSDCVIDIDFHTVKDRLEPVPDSDVAFQKALEMTIAENIPGIKNVRVLLNGVPRKLW